METANDELAMPVKTQRLLHEALPSAARLHPGKTAVIAGMESYTYGELEEYSSRLARALLDRGLQRGDRVAIYMENSWACVVGVYAVLKAGGTFVVINPQTRCDKLAFILKDSVASQMLTEAHLAPVFTAVLSESMSLSHVIVSGDWEAGEQDARVSSQTEGLEAVLANSDSESVDSVVNPLDLAALIYTSGSTGHPKGVMQTHQSMLFAAQSIIEYLRMDSNEVIVNVLPLAFDYGLYQLLMAVELGATLVLERSFTYHLDVLQRVHEYEVTSFPGVPTIYSMIVSSHARKPLCFPSVKRITNTAAALPTQYISHLHEIFPNALIFNMYGLTECKRVSYLEPEMIDRKPTSVGKAIPGTEIYLLGADGTPVAPRERGMLYVRGPHVMRGYWNREEETAEMLIDGLIPGEKILSTGDWFHMDDEGYLYFDGRSDEIIKCRGEKVSPVEVENALCSITGIREAAVIGVDDEILGQAILAYVVRENGLMMDEREIKRRLSEKVENLLIPKDIIFSEELPKNLNSKICKRDLV